MARLTGFASFSANLQNHCLDSEPEENGDDEAAADDGTGPATQGTTARVEKKFSALTPDEQERKVSVLAFLSLSL